MSVFHLAIASIVDANTGNGLVHGDARPDYHALEQRGRRIRSNSVIALMRAVGNTIAGFIDRTRESAEKRRDLNRLMQLNDHLLDDIGIQRGDLYSVQLGVMDLDELHAERRPQQHRASAELQQAVQAETSATVLGALNEQFYEQRKCA